MTVPAIGFGESLERPHETRTCRYPNTTGEGSLAGLNHLRNTCVFDRARDRKATATGIATLGGSFRGPVH